MLYAIQHQHWTNVCLNFSSSNDLLLSDTHINQNSLHILFQHLDRVRTRPIDVTIMACHLHNADNLLFQYILHQCDCWHSFSMNAPPEIWRSMNICEALLNELTSLKIYDSGYMSRHEAIYLNQLISVFSFLPEIQTLSICNVPLYAFTASLATFHGLTKFEVQLYRQAAEVLDCIALYDQHFILGYHM